MTGGKNVPPDWCGPGRLLPISPDDDHPLASSTPSLKTRWKSHQSLSVVPVCVCVCVDGGSAGRLAGLVVPVHFPRGWRNYMEMTGRPQFPGRPHWQGSKLAHYAVAVVEDRKLIIILRHRINPGTENPVQGEWDGGIYPPIAVQKSHRAGLKIITLTRLYKSGL